MPSFNLLDEGWIPCLRSATSPPEYLGIRDVLRQARGIYRIADPAPTVTASVHRLLLAILHRSLNGPHDVAAWGEVWQRGSWDFARVLAYLDRWRDRFDLFDPSHPFFQTVGLHDGAFKEISQLSHERASERNKPLLFDHSLPNAGISPAAAARYLLAQQHFSVGGMFSLNPDEGQREKFASGSPLIKSAVCLVSGVNLFETLTLNWIQYDRDAEMPFVFRGDDRPAWERDEPVVVIERFPDGWVDLLTWQCRRIALRSAIEGNGALRVTHVALMQGYRLPDGFEPPASEVMVAYAKLARARDESPPWIPVSLMQGRGAWRDSHALFQSVATERQRPRTLDWLQTLIAGGHLARRPLFPLEVYGIIPDQAKIDNWRAETLPLPGAFILSPQMVGPLQLGLELAERVGQLLIPRILNLILKPHPVKGPSPIRVLGDELLRYTSQRSPDSKAASQLGERLSPEARYWAALESPFRAFVTALPDDFTIDTFGDLSERGNAAREWGLEVTRIARASFRDALQGIESSARALRAVALAEARFHRCLRDIVAAYDALLPGASGAGAGFPNTQETSHV